MEFYRIEDSGQLKKRECFLSRNRMSNNIRFLLLQRMGEAWILVPGVAFDEKGCGSDTEEDFTIVT